MLDKTPPTLPVPAHTNHGLVQSAIKQSARPVLLLIAGCVGAVAIGTVHSFNAGLLIFLGFVGAFMAGLIGIGGGIIMIPLLLYVPPIFGMSPDGIHGVAGVTMIQVSVAGFIGMLVHRRTGHVETRLVMALGITMTIASLAGAILSKFVSPNILTGVFASLATGAGVVMLAGGSLQVTPNAGTLLSFNHWVAAALGAAVGLLVGMAGAGGGFLLVPIMIYILKVPIRLAIGTSLAIVAMSGFAGSIGKMVTGQVDWYLALALICGALPGAQLGSTISTRIRASFLALVLGGVMALVAIHAWWKILTG